MKCDAVDLMHGRILAVLRNQPGNEGVLLDRLLAADLGRSDARPGELQRRIPPRRVFANEAVVVVICIDGRVDVLQGHAAHAGITGRNIAGHCGAAQRRDR
ncbi:hypothetical protein XPR_2267 [Xanthomonas arboricola pv. pruni MAFF 301420]|uniref:Uncharacterized protein n=2 Tax=Xanthomonas arboricola pv. pruni TaxID=69929 RepID=W4SGY9_9XANT|nr:hypothetical protein F6Y24_16055 [Xanthomonas arboricola pv. pruni]GAE51024.1 hypothetical protein XPU_2556 [Xanthomonas arboricola pv. pruni str. MAFF 311562]GAE55632.1 hypothetical protein XPR_2267 [Xanthomonas arboricola pv. pruni MAFF 301420]GAE62674.1 hypothetical protein XPN_4580 [Xanthomonas arboricola pv. pruni MAFF 301427]RST71705.1 hypothetical protein EJK96_06230 [Xanthomonas arboricola pv. pruni]